MDDKVNGSPGAQASQDEQQSKPEFPFVRNMTPGIDGSTELNYCFPSGEWIGRLSFKLVGPQAMNALPAIAEDFRRLADDIVARAKAMQEELARRGRSPGVVVAGAEVLSQMPPRKQ
jgi:hypothetical protein